MMRLTRVRACLTIALIAAATATAADWPQWRGLNRDAHSPETGLMKQWPAEGLKPVWTAEGLGRGYSSATVAGGRVYVSGMLPEADEGFLYAFDRDGKPLWKKSYGPDWDQMYPGARCCPTTDGDRLYLLSGAGKLLCLDAKTGDERWTRDLVQDFAGVSPRCGFVEAPYIDGDLVVCTPGGKEVVFAGLDKMSGKTVWTSKGLSDLSAYCSPIAVERGKTQLLATLTSQFVVGFDPKKGDIFWSLPFDTGAEDPNHSNTPVYADGVLYVTSGHRKGGVAYEISDDGKQATQKWSDDLLNPLHGGAVLVDGYIHGANTKGHWVCLELQSGKVTYDVDVDSVGPGAAIYADGMLYCYGEKGMLALVPATPDGFAPVSQFKIEPGKGPHWAHPVISDGRLYIRHGDVLMAFDVKAK